MVLTSWLASLYLRESLRSLQIQTAGSRRSHRRYGRISADSGVRSAALGAGPERVGDVEPLVDQLPLQHLVGGGLGQGRGDPDVARPLLGPEVGLGGQEL